MRTMRAIPIAAIVAGAFVLVSAGAQASNSELRFGYGIQVADNDGGAFKDCDDSVSPARECHGHHHRGEGGEGHGHDKDKLGKGDDGGEWRSDDS